MAMRAPYRLGRRMLAALPYAFTFTTSSGPAVISQRDALVEDADDALPANR
jgi:hypothetical protein